ncbi:MAG: GxGYxYP domain-containing protein [Sedimentisphaeraceae bacterium JB056]
MFNEKSKKYLMVFITLLLVQIGYAVNKPTIYKWDLRFAYSWSRELQYDTFHMAVGLQGLANREAPRVFLVFDDDDQLWLDRLVETGGLCEGWNVQTINNISEYIDRFSQYADGVILYDKSPDTGVISTSLVATSAASAEDCIALRNEPTSGIYRMLISNSTSPQLPIIMDLSGKFNGSGTIWGTSVASTGSAKCDAYIWLIENYVKAGQLDTTKIVHTMDLWGMKEEVAIDHAQLRNLDYAFSEKAVCFELSPWEDEIPNDDPTQPLGTDFETFRTILDECNQNNNYSEMIKFCGFNNWAYKYTDEVGGSHGGVATEWRTVQLITAYNSYMEGDALGLSYVSNTSFYNALEPVVKSRRYIQNSPPSYQDMVDKGYIDANGSVVDNNYIMIYMGDYDQASWMLYWLGGDRYDDPARGQVPCSWALTPNSIDRVGVTFDYMYRNKSDKDVFIAGDSGAGYVQPTQLYGDRWPSGYADGREIWKKHCEKYYRMLDYSISGWILNGASGTLSMTDVDTFKKFSGDGIGFNDDLDNAVVYDNVPVIQRNGPDLYNHSISASALGLTSGSGVNFAWYRSILLYPQKLKDLEDECATLGNDYKFVDAYTYYYLLRYYLGGNNDYRTAWVGDDIPAILETSQTYPSQITVRNDGWDTWSEDLNYRFAYAIVPSGTEPVHSDFDIRGRFYIDNGVTVSTGQSVTFNVDIAAPSQAGDYDLYYDLVRDGVTWFRERNNLEWKMPVKVVADKYSVDTDNDGICDIVEMNNGLLPWYPFDGSCGDVGYMIADISGVEGIADCYIDIYDLRKLASLWLSSDAEGVIDFNDYMIIAGQWLSCNDPENIECWQD